MAGGTSNNPMQAHHKKQRKKAVQKNKQQRIKARDEKVLETKTVSSIQDEIKKLKYRKNLQTFEQQKLQRLEKELKLVKEAAAKEKQSGGWKPPTITKNNKPITELDDPRKSVYYDERLNPYGAPPPGRPRLYHQRGGGVTMDMNLAIVPGEEPPPPPPPPPRQQQQDMDHRRTDDYDAISRSRSPSPTTPQSSPDEPTTLAVEETKEEPTTKTQQQQEEKAPDPNKPLTIPSLPPPSKAVQRTQRRRRQGTSTAAAAVTAVTADIWASTEEVEYERRANQVDLEADEIGAAAAATALKKKNKKKKKKPPLAFFYKDMSQQVQGPFSKDQMREWMNAGFFPPTILVKTSRNETWKPIGEVQALQEAPPAATNKDDKDDEEEEEKAKQDRIAALKQQDGVSVQDRIATLKGTNDAKDGTSSTEQQHQQQQEGESDSALQDRIAAMRRALNPNDSSNPPSLQKEESATLGNEKSDVVAAQHPVVEEDQTSPYLVDDEGPALYPVADDNEPAPYPVGDGDDAGDGTGPAAPYPAPYPVNDEPAPYPIDDTTGPGPYPVDDEPAPYPVDDTTGPAPYPVDDEPPPYPVDDMAGPAPYPVDDETPPYPNDAYPADEPYPAAAEEGSSDYPVVDAYPATGSYPDAPGDSPGNPSLYPVGPAAIPAAAPEPPKKTIKVDKALVAFVPTNLRNKKRKPQEAKTGTAQSKAKRKKPIENPTTKDDDEVDGYKKFMEEIEGL